MAKTMLRVGKETYGNQSIEQIYQGALVLYFNEEDLQGVITQPAALNSEIINSCKD